MKFKVGDRVIVGPNGLKCVKAAAGKVAVVDEVHPDNIWYYLKFNEPVDGDTFNKSTRWFANNDDQISLVPPEGLKWIDVTLPFNTNGAESTMRLSSCDAQNSHLNIVMLDGQCRAYIWARPAEAKALRDKLLEIYPIDQPAKVEVAEAPEEDDDLMSWVIGTEGGIPEFYESEGVAITCARIKASADNSDCFVAKIVGFTESKTSVGYRDFSKV